MPTLLETQPVPHNPDFISPQTIASVKDLLFHQGEYAELKPTDLVRFGGVNADDTGKIDKIIAEVLKASYSILREAYERFLSAVPPNNVADLESHDEEIEAKSLITPKEETEIREHALGTNNEELLDQLRVRAFDEMYSLNRQILSAIGDIPADHKWHSLSEEQRNQALFDMLAQPPAIVSKDDELCYGLRIPRTATGGTMVSFFMAMLPFEDDFIVVTDPAKNGLLTEQLLKSEGLVKYMLAKEVREFQIGLKTGLENSFRQASIEKYAYFSAETAKVNLPVQVRLLELLKQRCELRGEFAFTQVFRDRKDVAAIKEGKPPVTERLGIESFAYQHQVRLNDQGALELYWVDTTNKFVGQEWKEVKSNLSVSLDVQLKNGVPEIRLQTPAMRETGEFHIFNGPDDQPHKWDSEMQRAENLLRSVHLCSTPQLLENEAMVKGEVPQLSDCLTSQTDIVMFFSALRGVEDMYPHTEFTVHSEVMPKPSWNKEPTTVRETILNSLVPPPFMWGNQGKN